MAPTIRPFGGEYVKRYMQTQVPVGSATLSMPAIIGIAVAAAMFIFALLALSAMLFARRKRRLEMIRMSEVKRDGMEEMDLGKALRSTRPPDICFSRRLFVNSVLPHETGISSYNWASEDLAQNPSMIKVKRRSTHLGSMRRSDTRDSWPLASNNQLSKLEGHSTMGQSQVAPPGYVVEDLKLPRRSGSRVSRMRSPISPVRTNLDLAGSFFPDATPLRTLHRRSHSENHLSTILRSTSKRHKAAHRRSLARTMSALGRYPGSPPTERLPTPPGRVTTDSHKALVREQNTESVAGFVCDLHRTRSMSPPKRYLGRSSRPVPPRSNSPTTSNESRDSLCGTKTPDLVIPASLTSPSRHLQAESPHKIQLSTESERHSSVRIHNNTRASLEAIGGQDFLVQKRGIQRISLASDPFYSVVKSSKPIIPNTQIQGPRPQQPLYIRKAILGQEESTERPQGFCSPLKDVSGNVQHTPKSSQSESPTTNPFHWSSQEAMQTRTIQTSPVSKRPRYRRKGHKRSNVIRRSVPRPLSSVEVVPEEPDEGYPLSLESPRYLATSSSEPTKNYPSSPGSRLSTRTPSSAVFNPSLRIPGPITSLEDDSDSPTLGREDIRNSQIYSPTLSVCNYYTENDGRSEDEFFHDRSSKIINKSTRKSRRHGRDYSADLSLFPTHQSQQEPHETLISFPTRSLTNSTTPILTSPSGKYLPSISFSTSSIGVQLHSATTATAAPPLLTLFTPTHLSGLRPEPSKAHSRNQSNSNKNNNASPPRDSVQASVAILRRMNSDLSHYSWYSTTSSPSGTHSPILPAKRPSISSLEQSEEQSRSRPSSKYYLSLRSSNLAPKGKKEKLMIVEKPRQRVVERKESHYVYKERRKSRNEEIELEERDAKELTPVREVSSPATGANGLGIISLGFPMLSSEGRNGPSPPRKNRMAVGVQLDVDSPSKSLAVRVVEIDDGPSITEGQGRWSDVMSKPQHAVIRRESKMEHPSPKTPPKWGPGLGRTGPVGQRLVDGEKENKGGQGRRPVSLGLYDQDGFLRSSPELVLRRRGIC
ncbi:hypothetical protein NA56DRAFT_450712 [Hyaloscypha hepaticicola]|uniref:Uncharacterized protein n=1 Tax=Hyaloscypha hepaticicola TaxID=2082293 RepID=A0A2J6PFS3_9HELO|nr:hypothetical protein NA56DRAFT_450712 [Hyaloscypha hepaticicola]